MAGETKVGEYRVVSVIGQGGMGKVYKAIDPRTRRFVIVKQLLAKSPALAARFHREAVIMRTFDHPNIVHVHDEFRHGDSSYVVMEFVDGGSLEALIAERGKLPATVAALILRECLRGLAYAHQHGVVHRDIKPDNILLSKGGEVKLVDFGIATAMPGASEELTRTGMMMGTPAYMSPEQLTDAKHVDHRSDIYAIGVSLYQMLTGVRPFGSSLSAETVSKIAAGDYTEPTKLNPTIPPPLAQICRRTMETKPRRRYPNCDRILHELDPILADFSDEATARAVSGYLVGSPPADAFAATRRIPSRITHGDSTIPLRGEVTIGREKGNTLVIADDGSVSRRHAIVRRSGGRCIICDLGSANGTYVNGTRVVPNTEVELHVGDEVTIGGTAISPT